ncbi:hypothetical protein KTH93_11495 [Acinetobacter bereziniae]|uniref:hypothetical protein n=1 Tax=Acinetobacter bereziniae TaxID=106648 RepID=UPI0021CE43AB|nr:hypothetical protein [Acinetobacter bereziniae]MCU4436092.1 hypothetical protein [Acinetobacter bereziniae]
MAKNTNSLESVVSDWLTKIIEKDELLENIKNLEYIQEIMDLNFKNDSFLPSFGFDQITRIGNLTSFKNVINSLGLLEIISVNKSFSLKTGEILKPDLICFNAETRSFVIFEIKRDSLTERQAITELAGYEQELRNILPFSSDCEINLVLISTEWDDLLSHAISSYNTWGKKNCLAIKLNQIDKKNFELNILMPNSWTFRGGIGLPKESLQTIDILLTSNEQNENETESFIPAKIYLALKMIAKQSDLNGINGFISLWKDYSLNKNGQWGITLCCVDSLIVSETCNKIGITVRESDITKFISEFCENNDGLIKDYLIDIAKTTYTILKEDYQVELSNLNSWSDKLYYLKKTTKPIYFDFFGNLGSYALNFVSANSVRNNYLPFLKQYGIDWTDPIVAKIILNEISNETPFRDGLIWCSSSFKMGVILGNFDLLIRLNEINNNIFENRLEWEFLDVMANAVEANQIYYNSQDMDIMIPTLTNDKKSRYERLEKFKDWVLQELITKDHSLHQLSFKIGHDGAFYFSDSLEYNSKIEIIENNEVVKKLINDIRLFFSKTLEDLYEEEFFKSFENEFLFKEIGVDFNKTIEENINIIKLIDDIKLLDLIKKDQFQSFNNIISTVYHPLIDSYKFKVDWDAVKINYIQMFDSGEKYPAVSIQSNGNIILQVLDNIFHYIGEIKDPNSEVIFISSTSGSTIVTKKTWEELRDHFE